VFPPVRLLGLVPYAGISRSLLARSLFHRAVGPGNAIPEPRGGGTARVERERQANIPTWEAPVGYFGMKYPCRKLKLSASQTGQCEVERPPS
jgi:hypothetical protein